MDTGNQEGIGQIWLLQYLVLDGLLWIIFLTTTILCHLVRFRTQFNHTFIHLINEGSRAYFFSPDFATLHAQIPTFTFINILQTILLLVEFIY